MMIRGRMVREVGRRSLTMTNEATSDGAEEEGRCSEANHQT